MNTTTILAKNADYNCWVTEQLVNWLQKFPEELLQKQCPSSFNSIAKTLKHISDTQLYWSSLIRETAAPVFDYMPSVVNTRTEMKNLLEEAVLLATYVKNNTTTMQERKRIESEWFSSNFPKLEYFQHLIIHTSYHRGQIVTIGHSVGVNNAPMMDFNYWNVQTNQL